MRIKILTPGISPFISGFAIVLFFISCSKDSQDSDNYLRANVDGTLVECTSGISANKPESSAGGTKDPTLRIKGQWSSGSLELFILTESTSLSPGEYVFTRDNRRSATLRNNSGIYYAGPTGGWYVPHELRGSGKITLAEINNSHVKGSFEFTTDSAGGSNSTITAGEFNITRH